MESYVEYEVYARYGETDIVVKDTLEEAIKCAEEWSMEAIDVDIVIEKVERTPHIKSFRHGNEVA